MLSALLCMIAVAPPVAEPVGKVAIFTLVRQGPSDVLRVEAVARPLAERYLLQTITERDPQLTVRAFDCGSDSACFADVLRRVGAERGLRAVVDMGFDPPLLSLEMVSVEGGDIARVAGATSASKTIEQELDSKLETLCERVGLAAYHRVRVNVEPAEAAVFVAPAGLRAIDSPHDFYAPNGNYEVRAELAGYTSSKVQIAIRGSALELDLKLAEASTGDSTWLAIGVVVLAVAGGAAVAGLVASAAQDGGGQCICLSADGTGCSDCAP